MFFVRRNQFSNNREYKFVMRPIESLLGRVISNRITNDNKSYIYKQDTEEVKIVKSVLTKLIEANEL